MHSLHQCSWKCFEIKIKVRILKNIMIVSSSNTRFSTEACNTSYLFCFCLNTETATVSLWLGGWRWQLMYYLVSSSADMWSMTKQRKWYLYFIFKVLAELTRLICTLCHCELPYPQFSIVSPSLVSVQCLSIRQHVLAFCVYSHISILSLAPLSSLFVDTLFKISSPSLSSILCLSACC
jgi:hypothetical protein